MSASVGETTCTRADPGPDVTRSTTHCAGTIAGGMVPKVEACLLALEKVKVAQIVNGSRERALMDFVEGRSPGTRIG